MVMSLFTLVYNEHEKVVVPRSDRVVCGRPCIRSTQLLRSEPDRHNTVCNQSTVPA